MSSIFTALRELVLGSVDVRAASASAAASGQEFQLVLQDQTAVISGERDSEVVIDIVGQVGTVAPRDAVMQQPEAINPSAALDTAVLNAGTIDSASAAAESGLSALDMPIGYPGQQAVNLETAMVSMTPSFENGPEFQSALLTTSSPVVAPIAVDSTPNITLTNHADVEKSTATDGSESALLDTQITRGDRVESVVPREQALPVTVTPRAATPEVGIVNSTVRSAPVPEAPNAGRVATLSAISAEDPIAAAAELPGAVVAAASVRSRTQETASAASSREGVAPRQDGRDAVVPREQALPVTVTPRAATPEVGIVNSTVRSAPVPEAPNAGRVATLSAISAEAPITAAAAELPGAVVAAASVRSRTQETASAASSRESVVPRQDGRDAVVSLEQAPAVEGSDQRVGGVNTLISDRSTTMRVIPAVHEPAPGREVEPRPGASVRSGVEAAGSDQMNLTRPSAGDQPTQAAGRVGLALSRTDMVSQIAESRNFMRSPAINIDPSASPMQTKFGGLETRTERNKVVSQNTFVDTQSRLIAAESRLPADAVVSGTPLAMDFASGQQRFEPSPVPGGVRDSLLGDGKIGQDLEQWQSEIGAKVLSMVDRGEQSVVINLSPLELGPLQIDVTVREGEVSVAFAAQVEQTQLALEAALPRLREMLAGEGLSLTNSFINNGMTGFSQNKNQHRPGEDKPAYRGRLFEPDAAPLPHVSASRRRSLVDLYA
jgi:hypothetical protein